MGRQHPLHFFLSIHSTVSKPHEGKKVQNPLPRSKLRAGGARRASVPRQRGMLSHSGRMNGPTPLLRFQITTVFLQEVFSMENETQLLCQTQTQPAPLGLKSPSNRSLRSDGSHPGCKPCCSGSRAMPRQALSWLRTGDKHQT